MYIYRERQIDRNIEIYIYIYIYIYIHIYIYVYVCVYIYINFAYFNFIVSVSKIEENFYLKFSYIQIFINFNVRIELH